MEFQCREKKKVKYSQRVEIYFASDDETIEKKEHQQQQNMKNVNYGGVWCIIER
ncbi:unnamed protein product [Chironomus riparius]|uniref:Uncharacterized protein n=1 Tax=Chironomus riparius TaxID=315576 RepID=A0A9N9WWH1_9DIPT|nr:unnamed protein product [Chironomus riparius]